MNEITGDKYKAYAWSRIFPALLGIQLAVALALFPMLKGDQGPKGDQGVQGEIIAECLSDQIN